MPTDDIVEIKQHVIQPGIQLFSGDAAWALSCWLYNWLYRVNTPSLSNVAVVGMFKLNIGSGMSHHMGYEWPFPHDIANRYGNMRLLGFSEIQDGCRLHVEFH